MGMKEKRDGKVDLLSGFCGDVLLMLIFPSL